MKGSLGVRAGWSCKNFFVVFQGYGEGGVNLLTLSFSVSGVFSSSFFFISTVNNTAQYLLYFVTVIGGSFMVNADKVPLRV
ncbi:hypothetical protein QBC43DRAFT_307630, partial [Cladorrhinum sp. PSN259]